MDRVGRYGDDPEIEPGDLWVQRVGRLHVAAWVRGRGQTRARIAAGEAAEDSNAMWSAGPLRLSQGHCSPRAYA